MNIKLSRDFYFLKIRPLSESIMHSFVRKVRFTSFPKSFTVIFHQQRIFFFSFLLTFTTRFLCFRKLYRPMYLPVLFAVLFNWDRFIISFLNILERWSLWFPLMNFVFRGVCLPKTSAVLVSKLHSFENFQENLTDRSFSLIFLEIVFSIE